ncbi:MAG: UDP-N-acetylglucosamine--N-acetylmuramyl-(pentapeptide) pyrophosphoryl-undecaprenol N-acetylglucosamine transferase [Ilumatobacteraceae bacterium]
MNIATDDNSTFAIVTGGGTAGHVLPALAIADALVVAGHPADQLHYVGSTRGIETRLLPLTPYPHTFLDVVGLQRSLSRRNIAFLPKLARSTWRARGLLCRLRPLVVVNVGGYASFPATFAARLARVPVVVVSYDRRPGLVSRLLSKRAAAVAVAFPGSTLAHAELTGAPVRQAIINVDRAAGRAPARHLLDLPADRFVVAVCCGSLGSQGLNEVVVEAVDRLAARRDLAVHHVVGERFMPQTAPARTGEHGILYHVVGYEERMPAVYAAADLLVTRAGAGTIAELAAAGVPAIVVPWPGAAQNHQVDNARELSDRGAAVLIEQADLTVDRLISEIDRLQGDPNALAEIAVAARTAGALTRSGALVRVVERVAAG